MVYIIIIIIIFIMFIYLLTLKPLFYLYISYYLFSKHIIFLTLFIFFCIVNLLVSEKKGRKKGVFGFSYQLNQLKQVIYQLN